MNLTKIGAHPSYRARSFRLLYERRACHASQTCPLARRASYAGAGKTHSFRRSWISGSAGGGTPGAGNGRRSKSSSRRSTASTVREERRSKGSLRTCQGQRATAFAGRGEVVQQQDWVPHRKSAQSGANVFRRHSIRGRDGRLPRIRAHERKLGHRQAIGKQFGRRHMDRVERAERMRRHEPFGGLQHFTSDLDQRAELSIGS